MGASKCTIPLLLLPAFLLLAVYFSAFHEHHLTTTTIATSTFSSSYSFPLHQVSTTTPINKINYTTSLSSLSSSSSSSSSSSTSDSNKTQEDDDDAFSEFFSFNSTNLNTSTTPTITTPTNEAATTSMTTTIIREKSSLEKIEDGLARARAAIREAVQNKNYTSNKLEDFIPRGSIYRNPYAFHQSHIEMEKRFRVWAYKEGEPPLVHDGPLNNIYSTEGQFIDEMDSGKNAMMAKHPDEAHVFYFPFSVANVIRYVIKPEHTFKRDRLQLLIEDYIAVIANKYPYWNRSSGADHFLVSCHDWAPDINDAHPELFKNFIRVLCNANVSEGFQAQRDVSLPEIYLPFGRLGAPNVASSLKKRSILAFFAGGAHGNIRKILIKYWKGKDNEVQVHEYLPKGVNYTEQMGLSKYCLCPSGWEVASPRVVEAIQAGCVPVLISKDYVPPFSDVLNWSKFSVTIPVEKIPEIKSILQGISDDEYGRMQKRVMRIQRHFTINRPAKRFDVMHMVLHSVWLRRLNLRLPIS